MVHNFNCAEVPYHKLVYSVQKFLSNAQENSNFEWLSLVQVTFLIEKIEIQDRLENHSTTLIFYLHLQDWPLCRGHKITLNRNIFYFYFFIKLCFNNYSHEVPFVRIYYEMRPKHKVKKLKQLQSSVYGVHLNAKYLISKK